MLEVVPFTVQTVDLGDGRRLVGLRGDLDMVGAELAWQAADKLLTPGAVLIIDLSRLGLADSSALRFLLFTRREAAARGASLRLFGVRPWLRERLNLGGVLHLFDIHAEMATALHPASPEAAGSSEN